MTLKMPEGTFGWGGKMGRPRIEVLDREPHPDGMGQLATAEIEFGIDPAVRIRLTVGCDASDSIALVRGLAFRRLGEDFRDLADHIHSLADSVAARDDAHVWRSPFMDLEWTQNE